MISVKIDRGNTGEAFLIDDNPEELSRCIMSAAIPGFAKIEIQKEQPVANESCSDVTTL